MKRTTATRQRFLGTKTAEQSPRPGGMSDVGESQVPSSRQAVRVDISIPLEIRPRLQAYAVAQGLSVSELARNLLADVTSTMATEAFGDTPGHARMGLPDHVLAASRHKVERETPPAMTRVSVYMPEALRAQGSRCARSMDLTLPDLLRRLFAHAMADGAMPGNSSDE